MSSDPGADPINIKNVYFTWINDNDKTSSFATTVANCQGQSPVARRYRQLREAASDDNVKFLARSIVLLWYLGSWYEPTDLKRQASLGRTRSIPSEVVSAKAYTQGLVWQIAGAHPMGYSNLQFGYWSRYPRDPNDPNTPPSSAQALQIVLREDRYGRQLH